MPVKYSKKFHRLTQAGQSIPVEFAFASRKKDHIETLHQFVLCRDYLVDIVIWDNDPTYYKEPVYGMRPLESPLDKATRLCLKEVGELAYNFHLLNNLEKKYGIEQSTITPVDKGNCFFVEGSGFWQKTSIHISLYSYLLRGLCVSKKVNSMEELIAAAREKQYMHNVMENVDWVTKHLVKSGYHQLTPIKKSHGAYTVHDGSGIWSLLYNFQIDNHHLYPLLGESMKSDKEGFRHA